IGAHQSARIWSTASLMFSRVRCSRRGENQIATTTAASAPAAVTLRSVLRCKGLYDHGDALAAADARRGQAVALLAAAQLVEQRQHEPRARRAERVAEGDRAAVHVQLRLVDAELLRHGED